MRRPTLACTTALLLTLGAYACIEPPPKIAAVPASGFALRLHVFGASAVEAQRTFAAVKQNNPSFALVDEGGDGEVLVGLENDSPHCVAPTAMCSYRVSYRITDNDGVVLAAKTTTIDATSDSCSDLCAQALNHVAVKIVELAVADLHGEDAESPADDARRQRIGRQGPSGRGPARDRRRQEGEKTEGALQRPSPPSAAPVMARGCRRKRPRCARHRSRC